MPIPVLEHVDELKHPGRKEIAQRHECQADVQPPETHPHITLQAAPQLSRRGLTQRKHRQGHAQHAKHAHHGGMPVVGREERTRLEVTDDRQIDQESENPRPHEIPEPNRDEEIKRPFVGDGNRLAADVALGPRELDEIPGIQGEEGEGHDFQCRKHGAQSHRDRWLSGPVPVMSGADKAAAQVEDGVKVDHTGCRQGCNEAQFVEDDGDHDRDEQLEKALDPQMDDPESPGINDRKMAGAIEEHGRQVKNGNGRSRVQKQGGNFSTIRLVAGRRHGAEQQDDPEDQAGSEQNLPQATQFEIFPTLMTQPEPQVPQELMEPKKLAQHAPADHNNQGAKEEVDTRNLAAGFVSAHCVGKQESTGHIGRRHPEHGELQMPGAGQMTGQQRRDVKPVKTCRIGAVVGGGAAQQDLRQEQDHHQGKEFEGCQLARGELARQHLGMGVVGGAFPSQVIEFAKHEQNPGDAGE